METLNLSDQPKDPKEEYDKINQMNGGANWFYWIAGLSLVNSLIFIFGGNWSFFAGLAVTQVADALVMEIGGGHGNGLSIAAVVALFLDLMVAGIFVLCGTFARKMQTWAFIVGMALYALDGVLALVFGAFLAAGFHVFALIMISKGFLAARELRSNDAATQY